MWEFTTKEDLNKRKQVILKTLVFLKIKNLTKNKNAKCVLKMVVLKLVVYPPLVVLLVSYCIY